jgi:hypothetical protein
VSTRPKAEPIFAIDLVTIPLPPYAARTHPRLVVSCAREGCDAGRADTVLPWGLLHRDSHRDRILNEHVDDGT